MNKKNSITFNRIKSFKTSNNLFESFGYASNGILYCFKNTRNFRIQIFIASLSIFFGLILKLEPNQFLIIISLIFSVLILELINTSIESLVDLMVGDKFNKLAKIVKDCSAGSVLLASLNSFIVGVYIFIPKIQLLLK